MSLERVEIAGDRSHVLVDGPLVVVEDHDEFPRGSRDVVEGFQGGSAGEGGVPGDGDDMVVAAGQISGGGHAERGGKGGARVSRAIGVVLGFGAQEKAVEALVGADRIDGGGAPGQHFVDVALMGNIEHELVGGGGENRVQGDAEFHHAEVRAEMAAGA